MEIIGKQKVWSFFKESNKAKPGTCSAVRKSEANEVRSFMDLATKVAELQFMNRDYVLLFRGQRSDYKNVKGNTSLKPSLFRGTTGKNPNREQIVARFAVLQKAERLLIEKYSSEQLQGRQRLQRQRILRWSILQHYEVCETPLLDVSHSLRVAASFASIGANPQAFVFVLGVPNLSGAITASAEASIQIVRLCSVCPPTALRPHIQEGYLLGEYPEMTGYDQQQHYAQFEIDFGRRLIAKFSFDPGKFWKDKSFPKVNRAALYPDKDDPLFKLANGVKKMITPE
jgi:hypothetical protein